MATSTYYTGIDLHKRTAYLTTVDENGTVAGQKKLSCQREALRQYFGSFEDEAQHKAAVETTIGWYWVADHLRLSLPAWDWEASLTGGAAFLLLTPSESHPR